MSIALILCQTCSPENEEVLPNSNPRCVDVSDQYLEAGTTTSLKIFAIDADGNKLTFDFTELPEFVTSTPVAYSGDSTIIILTIAPDESIIGVYDVVYAVNDGLEGTCASSFKIDVAEKEYAPVFESIADVSLTAGRTEEVAITAIDGNADAITFSISGNPGFLSITNAVQDGNTTTAELIIAPQEISDDIIDADITLVAEDEKGTIGSIVFHLTVNEPINVVTIYFCGTGLTEDWKNISMLARTHGQPASPTRLRHRARQRHRIVALRLQPSGVGARRRCQGGIVPGGARGLGGVARPRPDRLHAAEGQALRLGVAERDHPRRDRRPRERLPGTGPHRRADGQGRRPGPGVDTGRRPLAAQLPH